MTNELTDKLLAQAERDGLLVCLDHSVAYRPDGECSYCEYERKFVSSPEEGDDAYCEKHGDVTIIDEFSFTGYAGGKCFGFELSCGCTSLDESNDIAAAY